MGHLGLQKEPPHGRPSSRSHPLVTLSADGRRAFCVHTGTRGVAELFDTSDGRRGREFQGSVDRAGSLWLSADDRFAVAAEFGGVVVWEVETGRRVRSLSLRTLEQAGPAVCVGPDAAWVLVGAGKGLELWDAGVRRCLRVLEHPERVRALALSADERAVVSDVGGGTLLLWDVASGRRLDVIHEDPMEFLRRREPWRRSFLRWCACRGEASRQSAVDGRWMVSGGTEAQVWDVDRVERIGVIPDARLMHISADASRGLSEDGRVWQLDWELEAPAAADWHEGAAPHLARFLTRSTPYAGALPSDHEPTEDDVTLALTRRGHPSWSAEHFEGFIRELQWAGYGWLHPEGVHRELERRAASWEGPPPMARGAH